MRKTSYTKNEFNQADGKTKIIIERLKCKYVECSRFTCEKFPLINDLINTFGVNLIMPQGLK